MVETHSCEVLQEVEATFGQSQVLGTEADLSEEQSATQHHRTGGRVRHAQYQADPLCSGPEESKTKRTMLERRKTTMVRSDRAELAKRQSLIACVR